MTLKLKLCKLPSTTRGIYGKEKNKMGEHQLWAHPDLALALLRAERAGLVLIFSDLFRSARASRDARRTKSGVQPAGFSAHNFGLAADIDVAAVLRVNGITTKADLDERLAEVGLYCHRLDHRLKAEAWHYNALAPAADRWLKLARGSTAPSIEAKVVSLYGDQLRLTPPEVRAALEATGHLGQARGELDRAVRLFQSEWDLTVDGKAGPITQRVLSVVTAERVEVPLPVVA